MPEALTTVLADALPQTLHTVALGFDDTQQAALTQARGPEALRFVDTLDDIEAGQEALVAGPGWEAAFDGAAETTFPARLARLASFVRPGATLALITANPHSLGRLVDGDTAQAHPVDETTFEEARPASPRALARALREAGFAAASVHAVFGTDERWCVLDDDALRLAGRVDPLVSLVADVESARVISPVLSVEPFVSALAAAGALHTVADAFVTVVGGRGRAVYSCAGNDVQWLDGSRDDARWVVGGTSEDPDRATSVPLAMSARRRLLHAAATGDQAGFRELASRLGRWVSTSPALDSRSQLNWRDVVADDDGFTLMIGAPSAGHVVETEPRDALLARAWANFVQDLRAAQITTPWPVTASDDELVSLWLSMSGVGEERVRDLVATLPHLESADASLWRQAQDGEAAAKRIVALEDEVSALHDTLRARDGELAVRARAIRSLRAQVVDATQKRDKMAKANADIKNSAAFKLAGQFRKAALVTRPKLLVREVGKAADKRVRALRRAG